MEINMANNDIDELRKNLGWYIALSIAMIIVGVLAIVVPLAATIAIELLAGAAFAVSGIILVIHAFRWHAYERIFFSLLLGILYFAFGIFLMANPLTGVVALTLAIALFFLAAGVVKTVNAFRMRPSSIWGWALLSGIVSILLSVIIFAGMPLTALWAIGLIVGIDLMFGGFSLLMIMLAVRRAIDTRETFCIGRGECYSL